MANLHAWKLSAAFVKSAPVGRHIDGHGLMLVVQRSGTRSWIQRIIIQGKRRDLGLGGFPMVSLAEAHAKALANRKIARDGGDPRFKPVAAVPTFAEATMVFHAIHAPTWKNDRQRAQWLDEVLLNLNRTQRDGHKAIRIIAERIPTALLSGFDRFDI